MRRLLALAGLLALSLLLPVGSPASAAGTVGTMHGGATAGEQAYAPALDQLASAARSTAPFHRLAVAEDAGYGLFTDAAGVACIDHPPEGAMGIHYVRGDIVADGAVRAGTPEALVYEKRHGRLHLVALEYVVFAADWDANHASAPKLFGQRFDFTAAGNRYGLPDFYSLHVWLWKHNPSGLFAAWNPRVHCAA